MALVSFREDHVGSFGIFSKVKVFSGECNFEVARAGQWSRSAKDGRASGGCGRAASGERRAPSAGSPRLAPRGGVFPRAPRKSDYWGNRKRPVPCRRGRARENHRDANKSAARRRRTALPLVVIRLSRNGFYVLNGKVRYLLRACKKAFLLHFSSYPASCSWKLCVSNVNEVGGLYVYISFSVRLFPLIFIICKGSQRVMNKSGK